MLPSIRPSLLFPLLLSFFLFFSHVVLSSAQFTFPNHTLYASASPRAVYVNPSGSSVYVSTNYGNYAARLDTSTGRASQYFFVNQSLHYPWALTVDSFGRLWILDNQSVLYSFDQSGRALSSILLKPFIQSGSFYNLLAADTLGGLLVHANTAASIFRINATSGQLLSTINASSLPSGFTLWSGNGFLTVDSHNTVYFLVRDTTSRNISLCRTDTSGKVLHPLIPWPASYAAVDPSGSWAFLFQEYTLTRLDLSTLATVTYPMTQRAIYFQTVTADEQGMVWITTNGPDLMDRLYVVDGMKGGSAREVVVTPPGPTAPFTRPQGLAIDSKSTLFIPTYSNASFITVVSSNGRASAIDIHTPYSADAFCIDQHDRLYQLSTYELAVRRIRENENVEIFSLAKLSPALTNPAGRNPVWAMDVDEDDVLWVSSALYVYSLHTSNFTQRSYYNISGCRLGIAVEASSDLLYCGVNIVAAPLLQYDLTTGRQLKTSSVYPSDLQLDSTGLLYVAIRSLQPPYEPSMVVMDDTLKPLATYTDQSGVLSGWTSVALDEREGWVYVEGTAGIITFPAYTEKGEVRGKREASEHLVVRKQLIR